MSDREITQSKFPPKTEEIDSKSKDPEFSYINERNEGNMTNNHNEIFLNRFIRIMNLVHNSYSLSHPNIHTQLLDLELDIRKYQNNEPTTDDVWVKTTT